jgi:tetratricopeptide (TPR) repeat protein
MITVRLLPLFCVISSVAAAASWTALLRQGAEFAGAGNLAGARDAFRRAVATEEAQSVAPEALATVWSDIGVLSHELGFWREALAAYARALEIIEKELGRDHPRAVGIVLNIATVHLDEGRFAEADRVVRRAGAILDGSQVAPDARLMMRSLILRSGVLLGRRQPKPAAALLQEALAIAGTSPAYASDAGAVLNNLAVASVSRGDLTSAQTYIERGVALLESLARPNDPQLIRPLLNAGHVAMLQHRPEDAVASLSRALTITEGQPQMAADLRAQVLDQYARALKKAGHKEEARAASARAKAAGVVSTQHTVDVYTLSARPKQ